MAEYSGYAAPKALVFGNQVYQNPEYQPRCFSSLTDKEMDQIINKMVMKQFKKNETILYEEQMSDGDSGS